MRPIIRWGAFFVLATAVIRRERERERRRPVGLSVTGYEVEERLPPPVAELIR